MKIGLVTTFQFPCNRNIGWGAEKYMWDLTECLSEMGHEVYLFAKEGSEEPKNGKLIVCNNEEEVIEILKIENIVDVIHDFSSKKTVHDYCIENGYNSIATNFNTHFLHPKHHKNIVCISARQKYLGLQRRSGFEGTIWQNTVGYTGQLRNDAKVVHIGINTNEYKFCLDKEDYILHFNSFDHYKGIATTLRLAQDLPDINFIIAGSTSYPPHEKVFQQMKFQMDNLHNVKYETNPSNERKAELFQKAKAYVFPCAFEQPFAVVCIESLACGTPVITVNHGAFPEMVWHGKTGFNCDSYEEMKATIQAFFNDNILKDEYIKMCYDCRDDVINRFDRFLMANKYIDLYNKAIYNGGW